MEYAEENGWAVKLAEENYFDDAFQLFRDTMSRIRMELTSKGGRRESTKKPFKKSTMIRSGPRISHRKEPFPTRPSIHVNALSIDVLFGTSEMEIVRSRIQPLCNCSTSVVLLLSEGNISADSTLFDLRLDVSAAVTMFNYGISQYLFSLALQEEGLDFDRARVFSSNASKLLAYADTVLANQMDRVARDGGSAQIRMLLLRVIILSALTQLFKADDANLAMMFQATLSAVCSELSSAFVRSERRHRTEPTM